MSPHVRVSYQKREKTSNSRHGLHTDLRPFPFAHHVLHFLRNPLRHLSPNRHRRRAHDLPPSSLLEQVLPSPQRFDRNDAAAVSRTNAAEAALQTRVLASEPVPSSEFSFINVTLQEVPEGEECPEGTHITSAFVPGSEIDDADLMGRPNANGSTEMNGPNATTNDRRTAPTNCSGSGTRATACGSNSSAIGWEWVLVILLVGVPFSLSLLWIFYRAVFRKANDIDDRPPTEERDGGQEIESHPPESVIDWLENPYRPRGVSQEVYRPEDVQNYRKQMLERAKDYGYDPIGIPRQSSSRERTSSDVGHITWHLSS